jgi:hypothetical protein
VLVSAAALTIATLLLVLQLGKIQLFTNPVGMGFLLVASQALIGMDTHAINGNLLMQKINGALKDIPEGRVVTNSSCALKPKKSGVH